MSRNEMLFYIRDCERAVSTEFSEEEILREIFEKFREMRKPLEVEALSDKNKKTTAHLIINNCLAKKLRNLINAEHFSYSQRMPILVEVESKLVKPDKSLDHENGKPAKKATSSVIKNVEGEVFVLHVDGEEMESLSCIVLPLTEFRVKGDINAAIFLAQLNGQHALNVKAKRTFNKI